MMLYTHIVVGYAAVLVATRNPWIAFLGGFGAALPDIDMFFRHRYTLHNVFVLGAVLGFTPVYFPAVWVGLGLILHLCCDTFTYAPVGLFYPYSNRSFSINLASNRTKQFFLDSCFFASGAVTTNAFFFYVIPH